MKTELQPKILVGKNLLGPILYDFCRKLHLFLVALKNDAVCLFAYRGGVRLLYLYQMYLRNNSLSEPVPTFPFLISRILALKGTIHSAFDDAVKILLREYPNVSFKQFIESICPSIDIDLPSTIASRRTDPSLIFQSLYSSEPWSFPIKQYFTEQGNLLKEYLYSLVGGKNNILFVDTGWSGTTQLFLMQGFSELSWQGLYFGKWDTWNQNPAHFHTITGIGVEGLRYSRKTPETAILLYHHIIEGPLEPEFPSVEQLTRDDNGRICAVFPIDENKIGPQEGEGHFQGICDYFNEAAGKSISEISHEVYKARKRLHDKILYPSTADMKSMTVKPRSADFGRKRFVPILYNPGGNHNSSLSFRLASIKKSIWKQGKIVEAFPMIYPILLYLYNNRSILRTIVPKPIQKIANKWIQP